MGCCDGSRSGRGCSCPQLALGAVIAAAWIVRWPRLAQLALIPLLVYQAYPLVVHQPQRPLLGENSVLATGTNQELFRYVPSMQLPFEDYAAYLAREPGTKVGLQADMVSLEYPIWYLLKSADPTAEIGYIDGVGPGPGRDYWDVSLAWYEMLGRPRPEDWVGPGLPRRLSRTSTGDARDLTPARLVRRDASE